MCIRFRGHIVSFTVLSAHYSPGWSALQLAAPRRNMGRRSAFYLLIGICSMLRDSSGKSLMCVDVKCWVLVAVLYFFITIPSNPAPFPRLRAQPASGPLGGQRRQGNHRVLRTEQQKMVAGVGSVSVGQRGVDAGLREHQPCVPSAQWDLHEHGLLHCLLHR